MPRNSFVTARAMRGNAATGAARRLAASQQAIANARADAQRRGGGSAKS